MAVTRITKKINIKNATLVLKNFSGKETDFNAAGNRNFGVLLDDKLAEALIRDGWNVKHFKPKEDDPKGYCQPWLSVKIGFNPYPPIINLHSDDGETTTLGPDTVGQLDWSRIKHCEVIIRPYNYPALKGRPAGVSAYLERLDVTLEPGDFY